MSHARVLLVDAQPVIHEGIKAALSGHAGIEIVGCATNLQEAIEQVASSKIDVVVMELLLPKLNGAETAHQIWKMDPDIRVVIFTSRSNGDLLGSLMGSTISAYVFKERPVSELVLAIQAVMRGGTFLANGIEEQLTGPPTQKERHATLSHREREVFQLLAEGVRVKEAAEMLHISPKTLEVYKSRIMKKLHIASMTDWVKEAIRMGVLRLEPHP